MHSEYYDRVSVVRDKFRTLDMKLIASCFTDDVVVKYNQLDVIHGKEALLSFLSPRYHMLSDYQLDKNILLTQGGTVCLEVIASYINRENGKAYRSKIFEILTFNGDLISRWDYVGNTEEIAQ
ncbi:nuclear transport factor 2 family protein [Yersinia pseudotuberculosis]|uniref:nuclear transport factor 2 family protein n=1 Tax=Yersinia pseudotuberculosis TaxID=633 RepID=UPI0005E2F634|nr:nuclear transport factor 2 family protein [Yersinia pseudotuberculosis]CND48174.1 Ketosteroid isomerase-related protein [Yersinia pseudotuberculosis]